MPQNLAVLKICGSYILDLVRINVCEHISQVLYPEQWECWEWHVPLLRNVQLQNISKYGYLDECLKAVSEERG